MAVALAVLIAGSTVEPSALTVAAEGQKQAAVTTASDEPDVAMTKTAVGSATVSGNSGTVADKASGGQYGIATLSGESGSADDVVSLTVGETTTYYTCLSEAVAALPKGSDATLTLLNDCQADLADDNYTIGSNQSDTITLDLAGHALVTPEDYSLVLKSNTFIVMSSQAGGELQGGGAYVWPEKTAVFKENVRVTGTATVKNTNTTIRVEGADIAILWVADGNCMISSGKRGGNKVAGWRTPCHYRRHDRQSELHLPVSEAQYSLPGRLWGEKPGYRNTLYQSGTGCGGLFRQNRGIFV